MGGYKVQGKSLKAVEQLMHDALALERCGACCVVLEGIPREVAALITHEIEIPTIGIGAGPDCDGQVLVFHDLLGLTFAPPAKFVRRYADLGSIDHQRGAGLQERCEVGRLSHRRGVVSPAQRNALDPAGYCGPQARHASLGACRFSSARCCMLALLLGCGCMAARADKRPSPAQKSPAWKDYCHGRGSFCFKYPASWSVLGEVLDGNGVVVAPPQKVERENWDEVTVALVIPPPQSAADAVTIDQLIDQAVSSVRESGQSFETLERQRRRVDGKPAQLVKLHYVEKGSGREWIEELIFVEGPDAEIYSVALKCAPSSMVRNGAGIFADGGTAGHCRGKRSRARPMARTPPKSPAAALRQPKRFDTSEAIGIERADCSKSKPSPG